METIRSDIVQVTDRRDPRAGRLIVGRPVPGARPRDSDGGADSLRPHFTLANAVTTVSLLSGLAAAYMAASGGAGSASRLRLVVALIAISAVLDAVDGPLARRQRTAGPFGEALDSLADMTAFGVALPLGVYQSQLHSMPVAGVAVAAAWCVCAAWRLARHPLCKRRTAFTGCPVPLGAVTVGAIALVVPPLGTLLTAAVVGALMVGRLPFPTWHAVAVRLRASLRGTR